MPKLKYLSVCSGIEAVSVATKEMKWEPVGFSEIDPFASAVLEHHFPTIKNYGDIKEYKKWQIEPNTVDILIGGPPCQSFSVAGLRGGIEDPRGNLSLTFLDLANAIKPKWIVWENVPGVLSSNGGNDFGAFIGQMAKFGFEFSWRVLDAQYFGVPQRRRRIWVVASFGDWKGPAQVLFEPNCLPRHTSTKREGCKETSTNSENSITSGNQFFDQQRFGEYGTQGVASTCKSRDYKDATDLIVTPFRKSKRAQSSTDSESWVQSETSNTLTVFDSGDIRTTHAIVSPIAFKVRCGGSYTGTKGGDIKENESGGTGYLGYQNKTFTIATSQDQYIANQEDDVVMSVRRLTPIEAERLQGFPDNWTQIPWRGRPADQCPDSLRYKAIGNSMAVPVVKWILSRINKLYEQNNG